MPIENVEGFENCTCPHPGLVNLYECSIGGGTKIAAFVEIGRNVKIGKRCKIQTGAYIPEGVIIGDDVFIGPNVTFTNCHLPNLSREPKFVETIVFSGAVIGAGATILPGNNIGHNAFVGAGSVVTKPVKQGQTVFGNPAK